MFLGSSVVLSQSSPIIVTFEAQIATQLSGNLNGKYSVQVRLGNQNDPQSKFQLLWNGDVEFYNGYCSILLGSDPKYPITPDKFSLENPVFRLLIDGASAEFPVSYAPYAVYAKVAENVLSVDAAAIEGRFTSPVEVENSLVVSSPNDEVPVFFINADSKKIGINTQDPQFELDVDGVVNVSDIRIGGKTLESALSWSKSGDDLYFQGNVGIGMTNPQHTLDVDGSINAKNYYIRGTELSEYLAGELIWQTDSNGNIFPSASYTSIGDKKVGIGTTDFIETLNVGGGILLGRSVQQFQRRPGTISFEVSEDGSSDFIAQTNEGSFSLIGVRPAGTPQQGQLAIWNSKNSIKGDEFITWDNGKLGVGTTHPNSVLTLQASSSDPTVPLVDVKSRESQSLFFINQEGVVGIGTNTPGEDLSISNLKLQVTGVVDAFSYFVNGEPLSETLSEGSFWQLGEEGTIHGNNIFYTGGNVGIGTSEPNSLLELSGNSGEVALTFDVDGTDLFSIGVDSSNQSSLIFSRGSRLDDPVIIFNENKIGVGLSNPKSSLHVSGNFGLLVEGSIDTDADLPITGGGTRLMFFPGKAVFRAGHVESTNWDKDNLGNHSVGIGYNSLVTGEFAVVVGGYNNEAHGDYSSVLGGQDNKALGRYSFAAGYKAAATHTGSFVWADYIPDEGAQEFTTTRSNQFLIRASGGVGIGSNQTESAVLNVQTDRSEKNILVLSGGDNTDAERVIVNASGNMGIGTVPADNAKLSVGGGRVGIGTTDPIAQLTISSNIQNEYLMYARSSGDTDLPFVINSSGYVGVGTEIPLASLHVSGNIFAHQFVTIDPDDPTKVIILQPNSGSPWADPSKNNNNTHRLNGFIGIGTETPSSLLELSDQGNKNPQITFDMDNTQYTMGISINNSVPFFAIQSGPTLETNTFTGVVVAENSVGIGRKPEDTNFSLTVSGNTYISDRLFVATNNVNLLGTVVVDGSLNVDELYVGGFPIATSPDSPWTQGNSEYIYYNGNVGIGLTQPTEKLEVAGTISVNNFSIPEFTFDGELSVTTVNFTSTTKLFLNENNDLTFRKDDVNKVLSSPIVVTDAAPQNSVPLAYFSDDTSIGMLPVLWNQADEFLDITGGLKVSSIRDEANLRVTSNVVIGTQNALSVDAYLAHSGLVDTLTNYTAQQVNLNVLSPWGAQDANNPVSLVGLDINMSSSVALFNSSRAIGLYVDMTGLEVDSTAKKVAAVFTGGNVGIGVNNPVEALEVNGIVSANAFFLNEGFLVPSIVIGDNDFVVEYDSLEQEPRVGIGISNPQTVLDVGGTASLNSLIVNRGLSVSTLNVGDGHFSVIENGNIGIGTTEPQNQIQIQKTFEADASRDLVSQRIGVEIEYPPQDGVSFDFSKNITGLEVEVKTQPSNRVSGEVTGVSINLSQMDLADNADMTGVYVDVSGQSGDRYAAIFMGGNVGIGTTQPESALHVSGDVKVNTLHVLGNLKTERATFNHIIVNETVSLNNVTVNNLTVMNSLIANSLSAGQNIDVDQATFDSIKVTTATINILEADTLEVVTLNAFTGKVLTSMAVGTTNLPESGLAVSGDIVADSLSITDRAVYEVTVNIGNSFIIEEDGDVGIGTTQPSHNIHILAPFIDVGFSVDNTDSWNAIRVSATGNVTGLLFVPSSNVSDFSGRGSGILAQSLNQEATAANLLFITDPVDSTPKTRMIISDEGFVGIGTTEPEYTLHVSGNAVISRNLTVNTLIASRIESPSTITINIDDQQNLVVQGDVSVNNVIKAKAFAFSPTEQGEDNALFVNTDNQLMFQNSTGAAVNVLGGFYGEPNAIAYYDSEGNITSTGSVTWDDSQQKLQIGTASSFSTLELYTELTTDSVSFNSQELLLSVPDRSNLGLLNQNNIYGLNINFNSLNSDDPNDFGRLGENDLAVGLFVDMQNLRARYTTQEIENGNISGTKYSAIFKGGNVGIGVSEPSANLHITSLPDTPAFLIQNSDNNTIMIVNASGNVGIGNANPVAKLDLQATGAPLLIAKNSGDISFVISENIGIATENPEAALHIFKKNSVDHPVFKISDSSKSFVIVSQNGKVGIGLTTPLEALHVSGNTKIESNGATTFVAKGDKIGIGIDDPLYKLSVDGLVYSVSNSGSSSDPLNLTDGSRGFYGVSSNAGIFLGVKQGSSNPELLWDAQEFLIKVSDSQSEHKYIVFKDKKIGLHLSDAPSASLHVSGDMRVDYIEESANKVAFIVSSNGKVGIGLTEPTAELHVSGNFSSNEIEINTGVTVSSVVALKNIDVTRTIDSDDVAVALPLYGLRVSSNITNDMSSGEYIGLDINMSSAIDPTFNNDQNPNYYSLYLDAKGYGLKVDVSDLNANSPSYTAQNSEDTGNKYAAAFLGGNVGVGILQPQFPLHVRGSVGQVLAEFGTVASKLRIQDLGNERIAFRVSSAQFSNEIVGSTAMVLSPSMVGIGITNPQSYAQDGATLVVGGDQHMIQGSKINFKHSQSDSISTIGPEGSNFKVNANVVKIGYDNSSLVTISDTGVGIGTSPSAPLHVQGAKGGSAASASSHLVLLENFSEGAANTLAIRHSSNDSYGNYVSFFKADTLLGAIQTYQSGTGIRYMTQGADYAEYLEKENPNEIIRKGDVVGVLNGKVSKRTDNAQQFLVASTSPAVAGNWPGENKDGYELIAFFGQVHVNVMGKVNLGDYIIPSGNNDGTGIAIAPNELTLEDKQRIIGRAWSSSETNESSYINVAIGFGFSMASLEEDMKVLDTFNKKIAALHSQTQNIQNKYDALFDKQDKELLQLMQKIETLK
jgi:hypothetical protein